MAARLGVHGTLFALALIGCAKVEMGRTVYHCGHAYLVRLLVFGLVSVAGNIILMFAGNGPVLEFLGTGRGVLIGLAIAVFMILLGVAFLTHVAPQSTASATVIQESGTSQVERNHKL